MKRFVDLKISTKLVTGFLIISLIGTIIGAVGLAGLYRLWREDKRIYEENTLALENAGSASTTFVLIRYNTYKLSVVEDKASLNAIAADNAELIKAMEDYIRRCGDALESQTFKAVLDKLADEWENTYRPDMEKLTALALAGDSAGAKALVPDLAALGTEMFEEFVSFLALLSEDAAQTAGYNETTALTGGIAIAAMTVVGLVTSVLLALYIARTISKPLVGIVKAADQLAAGDIDIGQDAALSRQDEIGSLAAAFNQLVAATKRQVETTGRISQGDLTVEVDLRSDKDKLGVGLSQLVAGLRELVSSIYSAAEQVSNGSSMLSNLSLDLSQGATEQASAVQQLSATLEEFSAQTAANAQNAGEASELANASKQYAEGSTAQMRSMLDAMDEINASSGNISKIVKVIDDIAFQTNILALNAAVEAARAGQHGKGFAVVAEEVRTLAAKSAGAAQETTEIIQGSMKTVASGMEIAARTAESLNRIVAQIERIAELNNAIAEASQQQAAGIEQVNQGISQVSMVVQTNAATAEESAAASQELSGQAEQLKEIVSVFKVNSTDSKAAVRKPPIDLGENPRVLLRESARRLGESDFGKY